MKRNEQFDTVLVQRPPSNKFDLSHERKFSSNMGDLTPILVQEVLPGDRFKISSEIMIRLAPMLAPIMHRINVYTHFFFVPNRLVWDNWENFITGGKDGTDVSVFPKMDYNETRRARFEKGTLADYFGIPTAPVGVILQSMSLSALPFRAHALIYNEYYRDQNLTAEIEFSKGDGFVPVEDIDPLTETRKRAWEKDYFTSALPFAQRGGDVNLPVTSSYTPTYKATTNVYKDDGTDPAASAELGSGAITNLMTIDAAKVVIGRVENLEATQVINSTSVTIEELRRAVRLQEWLEKNARGGARYTESMLMHFGVRSSDARLQRPEYLGGGKQPIVISEVLNQAGTNNPEGDPTDMQAVGELSGYGLSIGKNNSFKRTFEEHGQIIGLMSVLPRTAYQQGINRAWQKFDKFDYAWPEFAQLGEQEVLQQEIYHDFLSADPQQHEKTFGYQSRYAEYKYKESTVHGDFKDTLAFWHMGQIYTQDPALNSDFVESNPTHRIFAVQDTSLDKMFIQLYNKISAIRPLPKFNVPKL